MPEHVSILQSAGVAFLALAAVVWVLGLARLLRGGPSATMAPTPGEALRGLPGQRRGPDAESVELTPEERAAFARLVRRFSDTRPS
ncbi:hypothetical protein ACGFS9_03220 [Streptomyces sp. NPDC048566]|uniref:hypothetical protein n=1 Tax=Streptomyces sp. NPDC048566 TaxID=3365569 RepID=UPI0037195A73